jgi:hypothetical protein
MMFFIELHAIHKEKYMHVCLILIKLEPLYVIEERFCFSHVLNNIHNFRCYTEPLSKYIAIKKTTCGFNGRVKLSLLYRNINVV